MSPTAGDPVRRFTSLYGASYGAIHAYAARRVGLEAADEIAAETFLVAWRRIRQGVADARLINPQDLRASAVPDLTRPATEFLTTEPPAARESRRRGAV